MAKAAAKATPCSTSAVDIVQRDRKARVDLSYLQRRLSIGYNRAARLLEQMEKSGLVSAMGHNGNREIIVPKRDA